MLHWFLLLFGCLIHVLVSSFFYHFFCNIFKYSLNTRADTLILEINLDFKTISMELQYLSYRSFNECVFEKTHFFLFLHFVNSNFKVNLFTLSLQHVAKSGIFIKFPYGILLFPNIQVAKIIFVQKVDLLPM